MGLSTTVLLSKLLLGSNSIQALHQHQRCEAWGWISHWGLETNRPESTPKRSCSIPLLPVPANVNPLLFCPLHYYSPWLLNSTQKRKFFNNSATTGKFLVCHHHVCAEMSSQSANRGATLLICSANAMKLVWISTKVGPTRSNMTIAEVSTIFNRAPICVNIHTSTKDQWLWLSPRTTLSTTVWANVWTLRPTVWGDPFYARSREIHLAGVLGHTIADDYSGADAYDEDGPCEYKSTIGKNHCYI